MNSNLRQTKDSNITTKGLLSESACESVQTSKRWNYHPHSPQMFYYPRICRLAYRALLLSCLVTSFIRTEKLFSLASSPLPRQLAFLLIFELLPNSLPLL